MLTSRTSTKRRLIRTRFDGHEAICTATVRNRSSDAGEMRIKRRFVLVLDVSIAARGIRLPNFDHGVRNRAAIFVEHAAGHYNPLSLEPHRR